MYKEELKQLSKSDARYLVIGSIAMGLSGYPKMTFGLDIFPDLTQKNLERIIPTLDSLGYENRYFLNSNKSSYLEKINDLHNKESLDFVSFFKGKLDSINLMIYSPFDFNEFFERKNTVSVEGEEIHLASLEDLLKLKQKFTDKKDLSDIEILKLLSNDFDYTINKNNFSEEEIIEMKDYVKRTLSMTPEKILSSFGEMRKFNCKGMFSEAIRILSWRNSF